MANFPVDGVNVKVSADGKGHVVKVVPEDFKLTNGTVTFGPGKRVPGQGRTVGPHTAWELLPVEEEEAASQQGEGTPEAESTPEAPASQPVSETAELTPEAVSEETVDAVEGTLGQGEVTPEESMELDEALQQEAAAQEAVEDPVEEAAEGEEEEPAGEEDAEGVEQEETPPHTPEATAALQEIHEKASAAAQAMLDALTPIQEQLAQEGLTIDQIADLTEQQKIITDAWEEQKAIYQEEVDAINDNPESFAQTPLEDPDEFEDLGEPSPLEEEEEESDDEGGESVSDLVSDELGGSSEDDNAEGYDADEGSEQTGIPENTADPALMPEDETFDVDESNEINAEINSGMINGFALDNIEDFAANRDALIRKYGIGHVSATERRYIHSRVGLALAQKGIEVNNQLEYLQALTATTVDFTGTETFDMARDLRQVFQDMGYSPELAAQQAYRMLDRLKDPHTQSTLLSFEGTFDSRGMSSAIGINRVSLGKDLKYSTDRLGEKQKVHNVAAPANMPVDLTYQPAVKYHNFAIQRLMDGANSPELTSGEKLALIGSLVSYNADKNKPEIELANVPGVMRHMMYKALLAKGVTSEEADAIYMSTSSMIHSVTAASFDMLGSGFTVEDAYDSLVAALASFDEVDQTSASNAQAAILQTAFLMFREYKRSETDDPDWNFRDATDEELSAFRSTVASSLNVGEFLQRALGSSPADSMLFTSSNIADKPEFYQRMGDLMESGIDSPSQLKLSRFNIGPKAAAAAGGESGDIDFNEVLDFRENEPDYESILDFGDEDPDFNDLLIFGDEEGQPTDIDFESILTLDGGDEADAEAEADPEPLIGLTMPGAEGPVTGEDILTAALADPNTLVEVVNKNGNKQYGIQPFADKIQFIHYNEDGSEAYKTEVDESNRGLLISGISALAYDNDSTQLENALDALHESLAENFLVGPEPDIIEDESPEVGVEEPAEVESEEEEEAEAAEESPEEEVDPVNAIFGTGDEDEFEDLGEPDAVPENPSYAEETGVQEELSEAESLSDDIEVLNFALDSLRDNITNFKVLKDEAMSEHQLEIAELSHAFSLGEISEESYKWELGQLDKLYQHSLQDLETQIQDHEAAVQLYEAGKDHLASGEGGKAFLYGGEYYEIDEDGEINLIDDPSELPSFASQLDEPPLDEYDEDEPEAEPDPFSVEQDPPELEMAEEAVEEAGEEEVVEPEGEAEVSEEVEVEEDPTLDAADVTTDVADETSDVADETPDVADEPIDTEDEPIDAEPEPIDAEDDLDDEDDGGEESGEPEPEPDPEPEPETEPDAEPELDPEPEAQEDTPTPQQPEEQAQGQTPLPQAEETTAEEPQELAEEPTEELTDPQEMGVIDSFLADLDALEQGTTEGDDPATELMPESETAAEVGGPAAEAETLFAEDEFEDLDDPTPLTEEVGAESTEALPFGDLETAEIPTEEDVEEEVTATDAAEEPAAPQAVDTFTKDQAADLEGKDLNGTPISSLKEVIGEVAAQGQPENPKIKAYFQQREDVEGIDPEDKIGLTSAGVIMVEPDGRMWIRKVSNNYGGYEHSFAKGGLTDGLSIQQSALKEVYEETGLEAEITGHLADITGTSSKTRLYIGRRIGGSPADAGWETEHTLLVDPSAANKGEDGSGYLNMHGDQAVAKMVADYLANNPTPAAAEEVQAAEEAPDPQEAAYAAYQKNHDDIISHAASAMGGIVSKHGIDEESSLYSEALSILEDFVGDALYAAQTHNLDELPHILSENESSALDGLLGYASHNDAKNILNDLKAAALAIGEDTYYKTDEAAEGEAAEPESNLTKHTNTVVGQLIQEKGIEEGSEAHNIVKEHLTNWLAEAVGVLHQGESYEDFKNYINSETDGLIDQLEQALGSASAAAQTVMSMSDEAVAVAMGWASIDGEEEETATPSGEEGSGTNLPEHAAEVIGSLAKDYGLIQGTPSHSIMQDAMQKWMAEAASAAENQEDPNNVKTLIDSEKEDLKDQILATGFGSDDQHVSNLVEAMAEEALKVAEGGDLASGTPDTAEGEAEVSATSPAVQAALGIIKTDYAVLAGSSFDTYLDSLVGLMVAWEAGSGLQEALGNAQAKEGLIAALQKKAYDSGMGEYDFGEGDAEAILDDLAKAIGGSESETKQEPLPPMWQSMVDSWANHHPELKKDLESGFQSLISDHVVIQDKDWAMAVAENWYESLVAKYSHAELPFLATFQDLVEFALANTPLPQQGGVEVAQKQQQLTSDEIMGTKLQGASGSNVGGVYKGTDGQDRYVKEYQKPEQAIGEHVANKLYNALGHTAPNSHLFDNNGKLAYASDMIEDTIPLTENTLTKHVALQILDGFAADVLTANWDVVGLTMDNILLTPHGKVIRVDNGSAFLTRAQGENKPEGLLHEITEWDSFAPGGINKQYEKVFQAAGITKPEELGHALVQQINNITKMRDDAGGWAAFVDSSYPDADAAPKDKITGMLTSRHSKLLEKAKEMQESLGPDPSLPVDSSLDYGKVLQEINNKGLSHYKYNVKAGALGTMNQYDKPLTQNKLNQLQKFIDAVAPHGMPALGVDSIMKANDEDKADSIMGMVYKLNKANYGRYGSLGLKGGLTNLGYQLEATVKDATGLTGFLPAPLVEAIHKYVADTQMSVLGDPNLGAFNGMNLKQMQEAWQHLNQDATLSSHPDIGKVKNALLSAGKSVHMYDVEADKPIESPMTKVFNGEKLNYDDPKVEAMLTNPTVGTNSILINVPQEGAYTPWITADTMQELGWEGLTTARDASLMMRLQAMEASSNGRGGLFSHGEKGQEVIGNTGVTSREILKALENYQGTSTQFNAFFYQAEMHYGFDMSAFYDLAAEAFTLSKDDPRLQAFVSDYRDNVGYLTEITALEYLKQAVAMTSLAEEFRTPTSFVTYRSTNSGQTRNWIQTALKNAGLDTSSLDGASSSDFVAKANEALGQGTELPLLLSGFACTTVNPSQTSVAGAGTFGTDRIIFQVPKGSMGILQSAWERDGAGNSYGSESEFSLAHGSQLRIVKAEAYGGSTRLYVEVIPPADTDSPEEGKDAVVHPAVKKLTSLSSKKTGKYTIPTDPKELKAFHMQNLKKTGDKEYTYLEGYKLIDRGASFGTKRWEIMNSKGTTVGYGGSKFAAAKWVDKRV